MTPLSVSDRRGPRMLHRSMKPTGAGAPGPPHQLLLLGRERPTLPRPDAMARPRLRRSTAAGHRHRVVRRRGFRLPRVGHAVPRRTHRIQRTPRPMRRPHPPTPSRQDDRRSTRLPRHPHRSPRLIPDQTSARLRQPRLPRPTPHTPIAPVQLHPCSDRAPPFHSHPSPNDTRRHRFLIRRFRVRAQGGRQDRH